MCRVNSYKANYRHSTGYIQVIILWTDTTLNQRQIIGKQWRRKCDWGNLIPRINVENCIKLGFVLE
jgi:hypothetical protein